MVSLGCGVWRSWQAQAGSFDKAAEHLEEFCGLKLSDNTIRDLCQKEVVPMGRWQRTNPVANAEFIVAEKSTTGQPSAPYSTENNGKRPEMTQSNAHNILRHPTDAVDAKMLATLAQLRHFKPSSVPSREIREMSDLVTRRQQIVEIKTMKTNRSHGTLGYGRLFRCSQ